MIVLHVGKHFLLSYCEQPNLKFSREIDLSLNGQNLLAFTFKMIVPELIFPKLTHGLTYVYIILSFKRN